MFDFTMGKFRVEPFEVVSCGVMFFGRICSQNGVSCGAENGFLVGGLEHFLFSHTLGIIILIDFHSFQRGRSTTNQIHRLSIDYP